MKKADENQNNNSRNDLKDGDYLNYLISLRNDYHSYHDHKETMAWVALVVYLGTLLSLITAVVTNKSEFYSILINYQMRIFFIIIVVLSEFLLGMFIAWEFWNRRKASYIVASYTSLISKLLSGKITKKDFKDEEKLTFSFLKVFKSKTNYVLPKCVEQEYKEISEQGKLIVNEIISYIIIVVSLISLIVITDK